MKHGRLLPPLDSIWKQDRLRNAPLISRCFLASTAFTIRVRPERLTCQGKTEKNVLVSGWWNSLAQRRKGAKQLLFFAPLRLCAR